MRIMSFGACAATRYIIALKKDHNLGVNTILHNAIIVAQFFKRQGRGGITRGLQLPERITPLPREYRTADLAKFFRAAYDSEKVLFSMFLLTGFSASPAKRTASLPINKCAGRLSLAARRSTT